MRITIGSADAGGSARIAVPLDRLGCPADVER